MVRKLGLNYGVGFAARHGPGRREVTLADAYWASHWHVLPLARRSRPTSASSPTLSRRFQEDNPNLQPFTRDDLNVHMRQADFPPGVREWLVALAHPVLGRRDINWGAQFLGWDRGEMQSRFACWGTRPTTRPNWPASRRPGKPTVRRRGCAPSKRGRTSTTVRMIEGLYTDGTIDRPFALRQLSDAGLSEGLSTQLLDIADFGVERPLCERRCRLQARDYLSGVLSRADAETQLRRIGIQDARVANYLAAWGIQRSARRKRLRRRKSPVWLRPACWARRGTRQAGEPTMERPRCNALAGRGGGKLAKRLAAEQKSAETNARQRAKELERLAKDADAQSKKLRAEANRIAPRSTLTTWRREGKSTTTRSGR
jgi:hypothetical protein